MPERTNTVQRRLRELVRVSDPESDADLLGRFVAERDEGSFARLVGRHGPMVLSVCRRLLGRAHDAEDAFQATFLVLARRAGSVRPRSLLANWLYGVAYRTALEARRAAAVRRTKEQRAAAMRSTATTGEGPEPDLHEVLDRELAALPEAYRAAVVVCDLEGLSRREAAARLGWTEGAVAGRLARARSRLARRLGGYGPVVPAGVLGVAVPAGLAGSTARLGVLVAAGEAVVAAPVAALTQGVMKAMLLTKLKGMTAAVMVGCAVLVTAAAGWQAGAAPQDRPTGKAADAPRKSDKDRIAELERERDRLLKLVADLQVRLDTLEKDRSKAEDARSAAEYSRRVAEAFRALVPTDPTAPAQPAPSGTPPATTAPVNPTPAAGLPPARNATPPGPASGGLPPADNQPGSTRPADRAQSFPPANRSPGVAPAPETRPVHPASPPAREGTPQSRPDTRPLRPTTPAGTATTPGGSGLVTKVYAVDELAADAKQAETLIRLVRRAVAAGTWDGEGGPGVVEYFQQGKSLVVKNTPDAHKELGELLGLLRDAAKRTGQPARP
jgi:RNA polymerase sigma factor (sigma-70 family)